MLVLLILASCQNDNFNIEPVKLAPIDASLITGALQGDDYVWTWPAQDKISMNVAVMSGNVMIASETIVGNQYFHKNVDTNVDFTYVFKLTDGTNLSSGVIKHYLRPGASKMSGISLSQIERAGGYDMNITWDNNPSATKINLTATTGSREVKQTLEASATEFVVKDVVDGEEWNVTLIAENNEGKSLPASSTLKIGKTAIGFLSIYATPEELRNGGDDDEICAWLWMQENYPTAQFVPFANIKSVSDIDNFRVLFWIRDLEGVDAGMVFEYPTVVTDATPVITEWYKNGGSILLWSHATAYIGALGRIDTSLLKAANAIGTSAGGFNGDTWKMAVSLKPGGNFTRDHSTHPIYKGMEIESNADCKLVAFKGPGWTEDHNCLYFDIPSALTGLGNTDEDCYNNLVNVFGIYPLGTWDSQIWAVSQLNVWEAQQGNTDYKGTALCIGNGGCEISMKNDDGTPDISANPKNNKYQNHVSLLIKNSLEYLKTR